MQIITDRRNLHRIPELDRDLPETLAYLRGSLSGLKCHVFSPMEGALCAWFDFGAETAIAFRADMDALPIEETSGAEYASRHPGRMHACGHDGHMAIALELARRLDRREQLDTNVLIVFQPAEETTGGAKDLCETGIFTACSVRSIFGLHLWPGLEKGRVFSRPGPLMGRSCEVNVDVYGKSAHIAKAAEGIDATAAAMELCRRAAKLEQAVAALEPALLKFGKFTSGTVRNALSGHARLEGSMRAGSDAAFEILRQGLVNNAQKVEEEFGCRIQITTSEGYPAVVNDESLCHWAGSYAWFAHLDQPVMTAEDFSWYQKYVPGLFFFLGTGEGPALHASDFDFDESVLEKGADLFEALAVQQIRVFSGPEYTKEELESSGYDVYDE